MYILIVEKKKLSRAWPFSMEISQTILILYISINLVNTYTIYRRFYFFFQILLLPKRVKNSSLVLWALNPPSIQEVTVEDPVFWMPLETMHIWEASITTATPNGFRISLRAIAICFVSLSWTWSLLAYISANLANLLNPMTFYLVYTRYEPCRKMAPNDVHITSKFQYHEQ